MVDRKKTIRSNTLLRDDSHQSFAQALNSPADSLFSDFQDFHARLNQVRTDSDFHYTYVLFNKFLCQDFVELHSISENGEDKKKNARPTSAFVGQASPIKAEESSSGIALRDVSAKKPRPVSADFMRDNKVMPGSTETEQTLTLLMFVVGGREVGQVTVFKRPISIWKLDLTKTF